MRYSRVAYIVTEAGTKHVVAQEREPSTSYGRPFMTLFTDIVHEVARSIDSASTWKVLFSLARHLSWTEWRRLDQRELAEELGITAPSVSRALKQLHAMRIVARKGRGPVTMWKMTDELGWRGTVQGYHANRRARGKLAPLTKPEPRVAAEGILWKLNYKPFQARLRRFRIAASRTEEISMQPALQVVLSGSLTFGVPLLLAVRELFVAGRDNGSTPDGNVPRPTDVPPVTQGGCGRRPLPACLIPVMPRPVTTPRSERTRELEPA